MHPFSVAEQVLLAENASFGNTVDEFKVHFFAIQAAGFAIDVVQKSLETIDGRALLSPRASSRLSVVKVKKCYFA